MSTFYRICTAAAAAVVLCFASSTNALAQPSWELGVKAGFGLAKLTGDDTRETESGYIDLGEGWYAQGEVTQDYGDSKPGFVGGAYAAVHINDQFGIRLEGLYLKKGGKGDNSGQLDVYDDFDVYQGTITVSGENTVALDYFEFPLLGVVSFPVGDAATFDIFAGPVLAFNTNAELEQEVTLSANGYSETESEKIDISDDTKGTDFGGVLGAGITFKLERVSLFGEVRYEYGFTKIIESNGSNSDEDIKNSAFGFMVGVGIPLAKSQ